MSGLATSLRSSSVINLAGAVTMVVDDSPFALDLTSQALLGFGIRTRFAWVSRDQRPFLEVGDYFGPDRRFRDGSPPAEERREMMIRKAALAASEAESPSPGDDTVGGSAA